jgi:hypothetical protein
LKELDMSIKAKLRVVLQADDTVVAESDDSALWQKILLAINSGNHEGVVSGAKNTSEMRSVLDAGGESNATTAGPTVKDGIKRLAAEIGVSTAEVERALGPEEAEPFLTLDHHCWEAMKQQTPERGPTAYSLIAIAGTLLALWFKSVGKGSPTQAQAQAVLAQLNLRDQNPGRGLERSDWLHARAGGTIVLNPAKISKATGIARSFCSKKWSEAST